MLSYKEYVLLKEAGEPPMGGGGPEAGGVPAAGADASGGGADLGGMGAGGPPGGMGLGGSGSPLGGLGGGGGSSPPLGDMDGGGGDMQPIPINKIGIMDVWSEMEKATKNPKFDEFFSKINIKRGKKEKSPVPKMSSLVT